MMSAIRRRTMSSASASVPPPAKAAETATCPAARRQSLCERLLAAKDRVWTTLDEYVSEGNRVDKNELCSTVKHLRKLRDHQHALEILEWMEMKKIDFSYRDHSLRLDLIYKTKGIMAVENYMSNLSSHCEKKKIPLGALLNCYCMEKMEHKALQLFKEMSRLGLVLNSFPFDVLMTMYVKMRKYEEVLSLVHEMKKRNIFMSTYGYNIAIQSYAGLNDIEGLESLVQKLELEERDTIDWTTYSNLAIVYTKAGLFDKAKAALRKLEEKMRPGSCEPFHFLITLYAGMGELSEVYRVWNALHSAQPTVKNIDYLVMLQALARLDDVEGLKKCFQEWNSRSSNYDIRLANIVVGAYLCLNMSKEAELVFKDATSRSEGPFYKMRDMFMFFFLENHQVDLALSYLDANVSEAKIYKRFSLQFDLVDAFFNYFEKAKDVDGAERILNILKPVHRPTLFDYRSLLKVYIAAGKFAPDMRSRLNKDGIKISAEVEDLLQRVLPQVD